MLSRAGKEILLKTVAQAMPNYAMNVYLLPLDLCRELEIMMNSFWWGNKPNGGGSINWLRWDLLCKPKEFGGIGFKQLHTFNIAMLGKQGWRLLTNPDSLVAKVFKARYFPRTSFVEASLGYNPSYVWRSIMAVKHVVIQGSIIQIGSGQHILIGKDPWLPDMDNGFITTNLNEDIATAPVSSLMISDQRRWDYDIVADIFDTTDKDLILQIPLSNLRNSDVWYWLADPQGSYSVHSCYKMQSSMTDISPSCIWRRMWRLRVPGKVKNLIWRAAMNVLPTADNLIRRRVEVMPTCSFYNAYSETITHALVDCDFAKSCWISSSIGYVGNCSSFLVWLEHIFSRCSKEECNLVVMICWRIWINRNDKIWNNKHGRVNHILNSAGQFLFQWQTVRKQNLFIYDDPSTLIQGSVCWEKPQLGWFKCNVDAATFTSQGKIDYGGVLRNSDGDFIAAKCDCNFGNFAARDAEALGVREVLCWIKSLQLSCIVVEMDCLQVFKALTQNFSSPNGFGLIIEECKTLAHSLGEVQFSFVRRSANTAAHNVTRVGGFLSSPGVWSHVPPPWLINALYVDISV
ncbi:hypothetical protein AAC387_Pa11g1057 [Persea americana]